MTARTSCKPCHSSDGKKREKKEKEREIFFEDHKGEKQRDQQRLKERDKKHAKDSGCAPRETFLKNLMTYIRLTSSHAHRDGMRLSLFSSNRYVPNSREGQVNLLRVVRPAPLESSPRKLLRYERTALYFCLENYMARGSMLGGETKERDFIFFCDEPQLVTRARTNEIIYKRISLSRNRRVVLRESAVVPV